MDKPPQRPYGRPNYGFDPDSVPQHPYQGAQFQGPQQPRKDPKKRHRGLRTLAWFLIILLALLWLLMFIALLTNPGSGSDLNTFIGILLASFAIAFLLGVLRRTKR